MREQTEEVVAARRSGPGGHPGLPSPCCHFRRPNFFPIPEKVSEAWLAVLSMVSWVVLASWSRAGEGRERVQVRQGPGNHLAWVSRGTCLGHCGQRALQRRAGAWAPAGVGRGVGGVPGCPPPSSPTRPFCPASVACCRSGR
uniref:Uncharacterized protein n=1 Tax=Nomascus leucogenys TaxID=61853 RepID=A0A2I3GX50_NOMLE